MLKSLRKNFFCIIIFSSVFFIESLSALKVEELKYLDYIIGEGDVIKIDFTSPRYLSQTLTVDNKGSVKLSLLGKLKVSGKTLKQLSEELESFYSKSLKNPDIEVKLVKSYKSEQVAQNNDFQEKLDLIKDYYLNREYSSALKETKNLMDFIKQVNDRDNQARDIPKSDLEISELKTKLIKKDSLNLYEISGKLRNNVNIKYNWVKSRITFYSRKNKIESVKDHYLVKEKPIYQAQIIPFEIKGVAPNSAESVELELFDYSTFTEENTDIKEKK